MIPRFASNYIWLYVYLMIDTPVMLNIYAIILYIWIKLIQVTSFEHSTVSMVTF